MRNIVIFAGLLIAAAGQAHATEAGAPTDAAQKVYYVYYQASELATDEGMTGLRLRIARAARRVCSPRPASMGTFHTRACFEPARSDALAQLDRSIARWRAGSFAGVATITVRAR